jgi:hypothetical protein
MVLIRAHVPETEEEVMGAVADLEEVGWAMGAGPVGDLEEVGWAGAEWVAAGLAAAATAAAAAAAAEN